ncbi:hypothetical protein PR048_033218 [Dryococelus australis]|uniref:DDE-1 domain-containing protein n=1 Tax=Dryococelus australis TaxID=614101 RepID=A0ABQ9G0M8_9NEOP|nr:hypothetical protein PR048_033218 [Dryococelus australis]
MGRGNNDVFNADAMSLFYKCLPTATFAAFKGDYCHSSKFSKERTTLLVANMSGTEKLPSLLGGKSKTPRCVKGIKTLPAKYRKPIKMLG